MMPIRLLEQSPRKFGKIHNFLLLIICFLIFYVFFFCALLLDNFSINQGFSLQQFTVKNTQLDSIICYFADSLEKLDDLSRYDIPIVEIRYLDSFPVFYFINAEKKSISSSCIFNENKRIVGYIKTKGKDVIVLTTINSKFRFALDFYKFLIPTTHTKKFSFIYFPNDMYCVPDEKDIPCPPLLFEPNYKLFIYKNDKFELYSD